MFIYICITYHIKYATANKTDDKQFKGSKDGGMSFGNWRYNCRN